MNDSSASLADPLVVSADKIDWDAIDRVGFTSFSTGTGRTPLRSRLIADLAYLEHVFDLSDEQVVVLWLENAYCQVFASEMSLQTATTIDPSSLSRRRKHLGKACIEQLRVKRWSRTPRSSAPPRSGATGAT